MSALCPAAAKRDAMTDGEFWDYVFNGVEPGQSPADLDGWEGYEPPEPLDDCGFTNPCPVCGSHGACSADEDGRPLIHATGDDA